MAHTRGVVGRRHLCLSGAASLLCAVLAGGTRAESAAEFYRNKQVRFLVGSGAGGGNDSHARLLAPHLAAELGADVIVDNQPGGGGLLALNQLYAAEPDGLTIMIANAAGAALSQLLGQEGVRFDLRPLVWLAGLEGEVPIIMLSTRSSVRSLAEARGAATPVKWAASGRTSSQGVWIALASHALNIPSNLIVGYKGSSEAALAAMRGEVDGIIVTGSSASIYAKDGLLLPVAVVSRQRSPLFADLPTVFESVDLSAEQSWWIDYCVRFAAVGRALVATPGIPNDRAQVLAAACQRVLTDNAVIDEAETAGRPLAYRPPAEVRTLALGLIDDIEGDRLAVLRRLLTEDGA